MSALFTSTSPLIWSRPAEKQASVLIGLISKTHHKTTPTFLLQFISTAAAEMSLTFKTLFMISIDIFLNRKKCHGVYVSVCMMKHQIHHTSSESSWNSILPLGVWLVSNGSSIPSPAALSSTCCCSTEYLCTKNLHAHSEYCQIIGATAWKQKVTDDLMNWPATTDIFLDKHNSCSGAQQHHNDDCYHNGNRFRGGIFYL